MAYIVTLKNEGHTTLYYRVFRHRYDDSDPGLLQAISVGERVQLSIAEASSSTINGVHAVIFCEVLEYKSSHFWEWQQDGVPVSQLNPFCYLFMVKGDTTISLVGGTRPTALNLLCREDGKLLYSDNREKTVQHREQGLGIVAEIDDYLADGVTPYYEFGLLAAPIGCGVNVHEYLSMAFKAAASDGYTYWLEKDFLTPTTWELESPHLGDLIGSDGVRVIHRTPMALFCVIPVPQFHRTESGTSYGTWKSFEYHLTCSWGTSLCPTLSRYQGPFFGIFDFDKHVWVERVSPHLNT